MSEEEHENSLLFFGFGLLLLLLSLIGFNIFTYTSQTVLAELLKDFSFYINFVLIALTFTFGSLFVINWREFFSYRDRIIKKDYTAPELEQKILYIVAKKKGNYISPVNLRKKLRFRGTLEELKSVLQRLRHENKIEFDDENYPYYKVRIP